jgi:PAS domain S-box-containing protein
VTEWRVDRPDGFLEAAPDAIVVVAATGRILVVNRQAERLFGYLRRELVGQPVELLLPPSVRQAHTRHRDGYRTDQRPRPMGAGRQLTARRRDRTEFPADLSLATIDTAIGPVVAVAIRDVTERLLAQVERDRRRVRTELDRLERLGQRIGGAADELTNLLGGVLSLAEDVAGAAAHRADEHWDRVGRDVAAIRLAAERASTLARQLLALGHPDPTLGHPDPVSGPARPAGRNAPPVG